MRGLGRFVPEQPLRTLVAATIVGFFQLLVFGIAYVLLLGMFPQQPDQALVYASLCAIAAPPAFGILYAWLENVRLDAQLIFAGLGNVLAAIAWSCELTRGSDVSIMVSVSALTFLASAFLSNDSI